MWSKGVHNTSFLIANCYTSWHFFILLHLPFVPSLFNFVFSSFSSLSHFLRVGWFFSSLSSLFSGFLSLVQHGVVIQLFSRGAYLSQSPPVCLQEANRRGKPVKKGSSSAEREILGSQLAIYLSYNELQLEYRLKKVRSMKCTRTTCRGRFHKIAVQKFWWNRLPSIFSSISKLASASNNSFFSSASSIDWGACKVEKNPNKQQTSGGEYRFEGCSGRSSPSLELVCSLSWCRILQIKCGGKY